MVDQMEKLLDIPKDKKLVDSMVLQWDRAMVVQSVGHWVHLMADHLDD